MAIRDWWRMCSCTCLVTRLTDVNHARSHGIMGGQWATLSLVALPRRMLLTSAAHASLVRVPIADVKVACGGWIRLCCAGSSLFDL